MGTGKSLCNSGHIGLDSSVRPTTADKFACDPVRTVSPSLTQWIVTVSVENQVRTKHGYNIINFTIKDRL